MKACLWRPSFPFLAVVLGQSPHTFGSITIWNCGAFTEATENICLVSYILISQQLVSSEDFQTRQNGTHCWLKPAKAALTLRINNGMSFCGPMMRNPHECLFSLAVKITANSPTRFLCIWLSPDGVLCLKYVGIPGRAGRRTYRPALQGTRWAGKIRPIMHNEYVILTGLSKLVYKLFYEEPHGGWHCSPGDF